MSTDAVPDARRTRRRRSPAARARRRRLVDHRRSRLEAQVAGGRVHVERIADHGVGLHIDAAAAVAARVGEEAVRPGRDVDRRRPGTVVGPLDGAPGTVGDEVVEETERDAGTVLGDYLDGGLGRAVDRVVREGRDDHAARVVRIRSACPLKGKRREEAAHDVVGRHDRVRVVRVHEAPTAVLAWDRFRRTCWRRLERTPSSAAPASCRC
jgi:hypothetical protein